MNKLSRKLEQAELWRLISRFATTEQERIVLVESFVHGLPPRSIQQRHADLFADVAAVYQAKRILLERLQHADDLQRLFENTSIV